MNRKFFMVLVILTCVFSCCSVAYGLEPPPIIDGFVVLPKGKVAPPGGINLKVIAENSEAVETYETTISEGKRAAHYSFRILSRVSDIEIRCELTTPVEGYYDVSYYTGSSQKPFRSDAVKLGNSYSDGNDNSNINITLVESKKVTGEIILPDEVSVQRDSSVTVSFIVPSEPNAAVDSDPNSDIYFSKDVNAVLKEGEKSVTFEVELPVYSGGYYYNYKLNDYISGISPDSDRFEASNKLLEDSNISLVLDKGNIISGVVRLPEGEVAEKEGLRVKITAFYHKLNITNGEPTKIAAFTDSYAIIPEGENSIGYEITVYPEYSEYYLGYSMNTNRYINRAYYGPTGTVTKIDRYKCVVNVTENIKGVDLSVLSGVKLSGKIMCPRGEKVSEDTTVILALYNDYYFADYTYVIEKGTSFTTFEFNPPSDLGDFILRYKTDAPKYANIGFYNDNGTTLDDTKTQLLSVKDSALENVQFYLWENKKITGEIKLPEDMEGIYKAQKYEVAALTKTEYGSYAKIATTICNIEPFGRSTLFEVNVPEKYDEVILSCSIVNDVPLILNSYLGEDRMVLDSDNAKAINPGQPGSSDLELVLIKGERISGIITVDDEHQYVKNRTTIYLEYNFIDVTGQDSSGCVEIKWEDQASDSQKFFINIPPRYMGEKFKIRLIPGILLDDPFYLGEDGVTEAPEKAKVFTYDGVDIKNLEISFGKSPSVLYGDVNSDGNINSIDLAKFRCYMLGMIGEDEITFKNSDLDLSKNLNSLDFAYLRQYLLKMIDKLPVVR